MNELKEGEIKCPDCDGDGEVMGDYPFSETCPKCKGKGTLDWIENIMGVQGTYIKPGVYTQEVDYSEYITEPGIFIKGPNENDPYIFRRKNLWKFVTEEEKRELLGESYGE